MLTDDKTITTKEYWSRIFEGKNDNAKVDASNTKRTTTFDRFAIVVAHAEGKKILGVGSGHAIIEKRIKAKFPSSEVIASDQCEAAKTVARYEPFEIFSAYQIPYPDKYFDLVIATQCMEYMDEQDRFLLEAKRVSKKFMCTVPNGEMSLWSQLRIYNQTNFKDLLEKYGTIEVMEVYPHIMLGKIKFFE